VGRRKEANISRVFILKVGRGNMVEFQVDVIRGAGEFGSEALENGVEHVLESIMEFEFGMVSAFEEVITKMIKWFST
jgi:hypothetical protein